MQIKASLHLFISTRLKKWLRHCLILMKLCIYVFGRWAGDRTNLSTTNLVIASTFLYACSGFSRVEPSRGSGWQWRLADHGPRRLGRQLWMPQTLVRARVQAAALTGADCCSVGLERNTSLIVDLVM